MKDKLVFDITATDETDNVGAYVRSSDGTLISHTNVSGKNGLDVNVINASLVVTATDLDIRNLLASQDSVRLGDGTNLTTVTAAGELRVRDADANTSLDNIETSVQLIDDTVFTDNGAFTNGVSKGLMVFGVDNSGNAQPFRFNAANELLVQAEVVNGAEYAEDAAHTSGDIGLYALSVRQDTLASSTSASGDYQSFKTDSLGSLWVKLSESPAPSSYSGWLVSQNTVDATAELIVASDLTNRRRILIQNVSSSRTLYIGHANTVTTSNGIRLSPGSSIELDIRAGVAIYAIANGTGADVRVAELAAA